MNQTDQMMTMYEVAEHLRLHPLTVRRLARDGEIPAFKVGRQWRVQKERLNEWMAAQSMQNLEDANRG